MDDVVIPVLGELLPILAAGLVIAGLYYLLQYTKGLLLWFFIYRAIKQEKRIKAERASKRWLYEAPMEQALKPHSDWKWVDDAIEEFNRSIEQAKRRE